MTALMLAAMHGDTEILEVLLEAEAVTDVQDKVLTASLSRTVHGPLHSCCFCFVQAGRTALMWATAKGHTTTVVRLLTAGANADLQAAPVACCVFEISIAVSYRRLFSAERRHRGDVCRRGGSHGDHTGPD
jgi:ankyrin repeat protein